MNSTETFNEAAKNYRDFPLLDAKFIDAASRSDIKQIFALLLSQERLYESIRDHLTAEDPYSDKSPFLATMNTRLYEVERQLVQFEEKYGPLSKLAYTTIKQA